MAKTKQFFSSHFFSASISFLCLTPVEDVSERKNADLACIGTKKRDRVGRSGSGNKGISKRHAKFWVDQVLGWPSFGFGLTKSWVDQVLRKSSQKVPKTAS